MASGGDGFSPRRERVSAQKALSTPIHGKKGTDGLSHVPAEPSSKNDPFRARLRKTPYAIVNTRRYLKKKIAVFQPETPMPVRHLQENPKVLRLYRV
jgi:hypothetical protein